jgi:adenosine deaminase
MPYTYAKAANRHSQNLWGTMLTFRLPIDHSARRAAFLAGVVLIAFHVASAAKKPSETSTAEATAARALDEADKAGPAALRGFLSQMPKGADLHMHLSGAIYAESFIRAAGEDGLCVDTRRCRS